jgi:hypothetical protein
MKKIFIVIFLFTMIGCEKDNIESDFIGCECKDGTLIFPDMYINKDGFLTSMSYEERQRTPNPILDKKICWESLNKIIINIDACNREMSRGILKYNLGGIKKLYKNNNQDKKQWVNIVQSQTRPPLEQIVWRRGSDLKPKVQCSSIAVSTKKRCLNITTNCNGKCWEH